MHQIPKLYLKKLARRRRRLRPLVPRETVAYVPKTTYTLQISIVMAFLSGVTFAFYCSNINTGVILSNFLTTYRNQYNLIVNGEKDYCSSTMDTGKLFAQISNEVINQRTALSDIELEFRNDTTFTAIAIVGTTGVGKSLFIQTLKDNFPWPENIQVYSWSMFHAEDKKKDVLMFLNYISDCGRNLIIIDSLREEDLDFVQEFTTVSLKHAQQFKANLIVVYIFNVITYTDEEQDPYDYAVESLQQLKNVKIVKFRKFNSNDVKDCIYNEAKNLNLVLNDDNFNEVFKSIDVEHSGCKNVHSKVLMFGEV